jgi:hypothetical protein
VSRTVTSHATRRPAAAPVPALLPALLARLLPALLALLALLASGGPAAGAAGPSAGTAGERPPSRLRLVRPVGPLVPGQQAPLGIETVGEHGQLLAAQHPVAVSLSGAAGLTATTLVNLPAGSSRAAVPLTATKPGLWQIEARAQGLYSASTVVVCVAPAVLARHQALAAAPARRPATAGVAAAKAPAGAAANATGREPAPPARNLVMAPASRHATVPPPAPATPPAPAPAPAEPPSMTPQSRLRPPAMPLAAAPAAAPAAAGPGAHLEEERLRAVAAAPAMPRPAARPSAAPRSARTPAAAAAAVTTRVAAPGAPASPGAGAAGNAAGGVRLIPEHLERYRGTKGWESVSIDAYWYEQGNPSAAPHELDIALVADQGDLRIDPVRLNILPGDFMSKQPAVVTAVAAAKTSLQALYPGGQSNPVVISFLAAPATQLSFSSGPQVIRGFGVVSSEVYVRLLDAAGMPAVADRPIQVNLQLNGPMGSPLLAPAVIPTGEIETRVPLELPRFGAYTVVASAANLADAPPLSIQVAFDWLLLLATLLGGVLGSLTRVLYRGQSGEEAPRRLLRVLLLGSLAALLVVLLSAFHLLSLLAGALPQGWSDALARVPLGSLTGVFLLGFLAGLLFDRVFGSLVSPPPSPAVAKTAAAAPPAGSGGARQGD